MKTQHVKALIKDGKKQFKEGFPQKALELLSKAINEKSDYSDAFFERGKVYFECQNYQNALSDFSQAIKTDFEKVYPEYYNEQGRCYEKMGQLNEALCDYEQAIILDEKNDKKNGKFYHNKAKVLCHPQIKDYESAIKCFSQALPIIGKDNETKYEIYLQRGICYKEIGNLKESISDLQAALAIYPDRPEAHNNLGLSYFKKKMYQLALEEFQRAIHSSENPATFYNNLALAQYHMGNTDESLKNYLEAIKRDPNDPSFYFNRGNAFLAKKMYNEAHEDYDKAISINPKNPEYWHNKGLAIQDTKDPQLYEKAVEMFKKAIEVCEEYASSYFHMGLMFHKMGLLNDAIECFNKVFSIMGIKDKMVYIERGKVYQDLTNHLMAINDFNSAINLDNENPDPENPVVDTVPYAYRGLSKIKLRRFTEAIQDFNFALDKGSDDPLVFDGLAYSQHALGIKEEVLSNYLKAITRDPTNTNYLLNRAQAYYDFKDYDSANNDLEKALSIAPKDPQILYRMGLNFYACNKYIKAVKFLKQSLRSKASQTYISDIYYHIGLSYSNRHKYEKAIYPYTKAIESIPNELRYRHERAKAYQILGEHDLAIKDFSDVIRMNPRNAHAYFRRAFSYKAQGKYELAATDFEKAKLVDPLDPSLVVNYSKLDKIDVIILCKPGEEREY